MWRQVASTQNYTCLSSSSLPLVPPCISQASSSMKPDQKPWKKQASIRGALKFTRKSQTLDSTSINRIMEAIRGARSLRSAATRAGLLQLRRPVSTQPPRPQALKTNADTTKLSNEEASALGASKKPPGSNPGAFMHQQGNLKTKNNKFLQPWLLPIYPMAGMVAIGVGLAVMTAYRELAVNPSVLLDKSKRTDEVVELEDKEWALQMSRKYAENSPLRKLSKEKVSPFGRHLDQDTEESTPVLGAKKAIAATMNQPPVLPGDDKSVHGPEGAKPVHGKPLGGGL